MTVPEPRLPTPESVKAYIAARSPLERTVGAAMGVGLIVAVLFSLGYTIGEDRALADNRADREQHDR